MGKSWAGHLISSPRTVTAMGRQEGTVVKTLSSPASNLGKDSPTHLASLSPPVK